MPRRQFRNRLSSKEMNRGVRKLESAVFQRRVAGILNVSECDIPNVESSSNPEILHTDIAEDATGLQLDVKAVFC